VYEAAKCVKPGGVFLLVEGDFEVYAEDTMHLLEPNNGQFPDGSWVARSFYGAILSLLKLFRHSPSAMNVVSGVEAYVADMTVGTRTPDCRYQVRARRSYWARDL